MVQRQHLRLSASLAFYIYGAAGSFVIFLIWVYYSALICFFGAEFTQVYTERYGSQLEPAAHAEVIEDPT